MNISIKVLGWRFFGPKMIQHVERWDFPVRYARGTRKIFLRHTWGVGWLDFSQKPNFSFRKSICATDRFVVLIFSQLFFWREKIRRPNTKIASKWNRKTGQDSDFVQFCITVYGVTYVLRENFSHSVTLTKCVKTQQRYNRSTRVNTHAISVYCTILHVQFCPSNHGHNDCSLRYIYIYIYLYI